MELKVGHITWVYGAGVILLLILLSRGFGFFIADEQNNGVVTAIGMLTFVSVFFSFVYSDIKQFLISFKKFIEDKEASLRKKAKKKASKLDSKALREVADEIDELESIKKYVNPELWLYLSVVLYLLSIVAGIMFNETYHLSSDTSFTTRHIQAVFFHFGFISTFLLVTCIMFLTVILREKKEEFPSP